MAHRLKELRESKRWTIAEAARELGYSDSAYGKIEAGKRGLKAELIQRAAKVYGVSTAVVMGNEPLTRSRTPHLTVVQPDAPNANVGGPVDLLGAGETIPVYGQAMGGADGEFVLNGNKLNDIMAPPILRGVREAYAVYVVGESMEPRYLAGEAVHVHPHLPVRRGDFVVVQIAVDEHSPPHGYIKQFLSKNGDVIRLRQLNPDSEMEFPADQVVSVHRIVGSQYMA